MVILAHKKRLLQFLFYVLAVLLLVMHMKPAAVAFSSGFGNGSGVGCIESERQALLKIKDELIDSSGFLSSWGSEDDKRDCCKWRGISCSDRTGHVTSLDFFDMLLRGKMSDSLYELRHLTYLGLSYNDFGGSQFPNTNNGSFPKLEYLDLFDCYFSGTISSVLRNLSSLLYLNLGSNEFGDIGNVEWLFGLSSLSQLYLSGTHLIRPNSWLQIPNKLPYLEILDLRSCFFGEDDEIPLTLSPINSSSSLMLLDLSGWHNLVIPSIYLQWLSNITQNIRSLDLSSNNLQPSTLANFQNMISLESLYLSNATLEGDIPKSFGNMCRLVRLDLSYNNFSLQLPDLIQNLSGCTQKSLQFLYLDGNQLTGSLPDLTRFASLSWLSLSYNRLNGTVDKSIVRMSNLEMLNLGWNLLHGVISEDLFSNMSKLSYLYLSSNSFIWNISLNWVPPFHLSIIHLQSCKMGPHFPRWLQYQKNYSELDMSDNGISDSVPKWFWELSFDFDHLNISYNNLRGKVPNLSFKFENAESSVVDVSFNCFSGPLPLLSSKPDSSVYFPRRLKLSNGGSVPGTLVGLDLSNNKFSGVLADPFFINVRDLLFLNLANNSLSGQIPTSIRLLSKLVSLNLEKNAFSGELPSSLKNCTRLIFLDFSGNKLSRHTLWIGESLPSLQFLRFRHNNFHGNIPSQLCQLRNIQILDLSFNYLNGRIPSCFQNLTSMTNHNSTKTIGLFYSDFNILLISNPRQLYMDKAMVLWKGKNYICDKNLGQFRMIDLSRNSIEGEIPKELTSLIELQQLNLSNNMLTGAIPRKIGSLKQLESLDLSHNKLSGKLLDSMASLNFLSTVDLSYNDFSGRIPSGPQVQTSNASAFAGNPALCGPPLTQNCPGDDVSICT